MHYRLIVFPVALVAATLGSGAIPGVADDAIGKPPSLETAAFTSGLDDAAGWTPLPRVLDRADADRYGDIFRLQEGGRWKEADRLIAVLDNRLLMGHVLAQRYLHPTKYRSRYKELKEWMALYADHPDARRLYKLALRRKPKTWRAPISPIVARPAAAAAAYARQTAAGPRPGLTSQQRRRAAQYRKQIHGYLRKGWTKAAKQMLGKSEVKALLSPFEFDSARARLGAGYFADGHDEWALQWARAAAARSGAIVPEAHWTAGLAAWRLKRYAEAERNFHKVAVMSDTSPWLISASAFWAARALLVDRRPENATRLLGIAAGYPHTFYGLLARRVLGLPVSFRWSTPEVEQAGVKLLAAESSGRRALALAQVEEDGRAERELLSLSGSADGALARGILALASRARMPALSMRLAGALFPGATFDGALYPVAPWTPPGGFRVDRALIYALIRQESAFNPMAKSWAGARGLMQLMPRTAGFVAQDRRYRSSKRTHLFRPEVNLELGQKYIEMLLADPKINGDLFQLAVAWNGGPGNLSKWLRRTDHGNDPLLFIEGIPSKETRIFIERVLANLWIYRDRLGQPKPSLDAIAAGEWPVYAPLDRPSLPGALTELKDTQDQR
jgi:soluble lytic murein transglycosylase-like protein